MALRRVWASERFCWWLTNSLYVFPDDYAFETRIKLSEFYDLLRSTHAAALVAEQYAGLPFEERAPSTAISACLVRRRLHREPDEGTEPSPRLRSVRLLCFWRRNRWARTRITLSAKNGVFLTRKTN